MLSRVADSLYWIHRYLERAENISRFLEVSEAMALDCPPGSAEPWLPLVDVTADRQRFNQAYPAGTPGDVLRFLLHDRDNPNSIVSCIAIARENARQIRDVITSEMWEQLNDLHWSLQTGEAIWSEPVQEQLRIIRRGCQMVYGITDATLSRDVSWLFSQLGRLIERADKTSRILDMKYFLLLPSPDDVGGVLDELQWITVLRTAGAYQMYRQSQQQAITPASVADFLLLDPIFPRSVRFCLQGINGTLKQLQMLDALNVDFSSTDTNGKNIFQLALYEGREGEIIDYCCEKYYTQRVAYHVVGPRAHTAPIKIKLRLLKRVPYSIVGPKTVGSMAPMKIKTA